MATNVLPSGGRRSSSGDSMYCAIKMAVLGVQFQTSSLATARSAILLACNDINTLSTCNSSSSSLTRLHDDGCEREKRFNTTQKTAANIML